jgi:amino acid transporter
VRRSQGTLGTFGGVFTPSILTILGLILFLRLGWIVGSEGLARALVIVALAHVVSVLTSLSLAAIATNRRVRGGGDYFLISRTLGLEYGGALGLVLFGAQATAVAFYCYGFGEAVVALPLAFPDWVTPRSVALLAAGALFAVAWFGADVATRFQYLIMALIGVALAAFLVGASGDASAARLADAWQAPAGALPFWAAFALFFPAVTGFTQGVSLSGDLRDPSRSLPLGTFAAVGVSLVAYAGIAVLFAAAQPLAELRGDYLALKRLSAAPILADAGVIAATLSSALASLLGAPRILQAMARDRLFRALLPFGAGGPKDNPRRALLLAGGIALVAIALGDLNAIAPVISMSLLISYALLNYATFVEARGNSPSFRPRFRFFHAYASLAGTLVCGAFMLAIAPLPGLLALAFVAAVYQFLKANAVPGRWADSRRAYGFRMLKQTLRRLSSQPESEWSHQPHVLAFTEDAEQRDLLVRFGSWLSGTSGLTVCVEIVEAAEDLEGTRRRCRAAEEELAEELKEQELDAFPRVIAAEKRRIGMNSFLQSWGVGPIRATLVLTDWHPSLADEEPDAESLDYGRQLLAVVRHECDLVLLDLRARDWRRIQASDPDDRRIDVLWHGGSSSRLSLLLAYLMTRAEEFADATLRVLAVAAPEREDRERASLEHLLQEARIDAEIVFAADAEALVAAAEDASVAFVPVAVESMHRVRSELELELADAVERLPMACLVAAAHEIQLTQDEEERAAEQNAEQSAEQGAEQSGQQEGQAREPERDA